MDQIADKRDPERAVVRTVLPAPAILREAISGECRPAYHTVSNAGSSGDSAAC